MIENKDNKDDESMSEESDEDTQAPQKGKKGKRCKKNKEFGGLPRKCFKRLIKKELDKQCEQLFKSMLNCPELGGEVSDQINSANQEVHSTVICDGCEATPIMGVRYKCSVCKNFDFCSMCEERRCHEHPFLKIYKADQVPKAMFTVIDEQMPNAKPDIEQNMNEEQQFPTFFRNMMSHMMNGMQRGGRGGRGGCGRGRWGGHGHHHDHPHGQWREKKAQIVSVPKEALIGKPGDIIIAEIEVQNGMEWHWKEGATLQSVYNNSTAEFLDEVAIPVDF